MFDNMNISTQIGFGILYLILAGAYATTFFINVSNKVELFNRIKTWFYIITFLFLILSFNKYITILGFMVISYLAFNEYIKNVGLREQDKHIVWFSYLMIPFQYLWIMVGWYGMAIVFLPVYLFLLIPLFLIISKETQGFLKSAGTIFWGMMATVFCLSHVPLLYTFSENATALIFFLLILTEINDISQYIWGKCIGRIKVTPVSPNKTLGGLLGGVFTTALVSYLISPLFTPFSTLESIMIGVIIALAGFIGDLSMSAIKRDLGIKDYSNFLPGHGGILDRLDSLIYTAPIFFHYIHYLHV